jgi:hypothetical protein
MRWRSSSQKQQSEQPISDSICHKANLCLIWYGRVTLEPQNINAFSMKFSRMSELTEFAYISTTSSRMLDLSISLLLWFGGLFLIYICEMYILFFPSFTLKGRFDKFYSSAIYFSLSKKPPNFPVWCFDEISRRILSWCRLPYISYHIITPLEVILHLCYI